MEKEKKEIVDKASENDEKDNNKKRGFIDSLLEEPSKENENNEDDKLSFNDFKNITKRNRNSNSKINSRFSSCSIEK